MCKRCTPRSSAKNRNRAWDWSRYHYGSLEFIRSPSSSAALISGATREDLAAIVWTRAAFRRRRKRVGPAVALSNSNRNSRRPSAERRFSRQIVRSATRRAGSDRKARVIRRWLVLKLPTVDLVVWPWLY